MAQVCISHYEIVNELVPSVCMKCGEPATTWRKRHFSWTPSWIFILFFCGGVLPLLIAYMLTVKRMMAEIPFCDEHQNHYSWRRKLYAFLFLIYVCAAIGAFVTLDYLPRGDDLQAVIFIGLLVILVGFLIVAALVQQAGICAKKITDRDITLSNVSKGFVVAIEDDRERDEEEVRERHARKKARRERDEYDRNSRDEEEGSE